MDISSALERVHNRIVITDRLKKLISCLPDKQLGNLSNKTLPSITKRENIDSMIRHLYYCSVLSDYYYFPLWLYT